MSCRKSKIIFQDHNIPLSWENVEIRGFEPPDLLHATQGRAVAGWGRASACEPFTCGNPGPMWPDVARRLPTLAPNLAPRKLVSDANVRQGRTGCRPAYASLGTPNARGPLTLYLGTSSL